jgi:peptidoglycan/xylan/chitin deacetylase (PgdA/CDA1 family)
LLIADGSYSWVSDNSSVAVTNNQAFAHPNNSIVGFTASDCTPNSASGRVRITSMTTFNLEETITVGIQSLALPASGIALEIAFSSDNFATKSFKYSYSGTASQTWFRNGVTYMTIGINENGTVQNGGISANAWTSVGGQLATDAFNSVQITFNGLSGILVKVLGVWTNKKTTGKILLGFDDALLSQYTEGFSYMESKGIRGTIALPQGLVGTGGYCSQAQLDEMYSAGWDYVGHSSNHVDLTAQTAAVVLSEVRQNKQYIDARYPRAADCMVYPENKYNATVTAACRRAGWRYMRATARRYISCDAFGLDNYDAIGSQSTSTMTVQNIKDCILSTANTGQVLWLYSHNILSINNPNGTGGSPPTSPVTDYYRDDFRAIVDYIAALKEQGLVEDITWSDLQAHLDGPIQVYQ